MVVDWGYKKATRMVAPIILKGFNLLFAKIKEENIIEFS